MLALVLFSLPVGFLLVLPLTALAVRWGRRMGAMDSPGVVGHEKVLRSVPNIGGIPLAIGVLGPVFIGLLAMAIWGGEIVYSLVPEASDFADRLASQQRAWWSILIGGLFLHLIGLLDDRRPLPPWPKLGAQVLVALLVVFIGELRLLTALDAFGPAGVSLSATLTVVWIVLITNAFNFLDNMDGLSGGVAAIAAAIFMAATIINGQFFTAAAFGLLCGGLLGFLSFNVPPARIFMGDGGSYFLGFSLAAISVIGPAKELTTVSLLLPLLILSLPLADM